MRGMNQMKKTKPVKRVLHRKLNRSHFGNFAVFTILAFIGVFIALPMVFAVGNSFKPLEELWVFPPSLFPSNPTMTNFKGLFRLLQGSWVPMSRYLFNTVFITVCGTFGHVIFASLCAYAFAKHKFPGRAFLFSLVVFALMFNASVTSVPNYYIMKTLRWIDTYFAVIIPSFGSALGLFLMKQFMEQIPDSYIEAAKIDGAREFRIFWTIIMPMVKPAWLTLMIFTFQSIWNTQGTQYIYKENLKTLPTALNQLTSSGLSMAGVSSAVAVFLMLPPIIMFLFAQSNVLETMSHSGIKD